MISKVHYENGEISFHYIYGLRIRGILITYCVCDVLFYGYTSMTKENMMVMCRENIEFDHFKIKVSYKFEMLCNL